MKKLLLPLVCLFFVLSGNINNAAAQQTEPAATAQNVSEALKMMNGSWKWTETQRIGRGIKPSAKTPASTGQNITVTFKPNNHALVFVNKELVGTYRFELTQRPNEYLMLSFHDETGRNIAAPYLEQGPLTVSADELYISGSYNDAGSNQTFKKITTSKEEKPKAKPRKVKKKK